MIPQVVDESVSRVKFDRELAEFAEQKSHYRSRGIFLTEAAFPYALAILATPNLKPASLVFGVRFDYSDYDATPPSVRFVNPFTGVNLLAKELPTKMPRPGPTHDVQLPGVPQGLMQINEVQELLQAYGPDDMPFLCLPGVREYHSHPAHTGDSWELHRSTGAGRLVQLLDVIQRYAVSTITGYNIQLVPRLAGFQIAPPAP